MTHFGGPNRCKNEGKRRERETKGVFFLGRPKESKSIDDLTYFAPKARFFFAGVGRFYRRIHPFKVGLPVYNVELTTFFRILTEL